MKPDHISILVEEYLEFFSGKSLRTFVDGTVGAGGHARAILEAHPEIERFYAFDQDPDALEIAKETLKEFDVTFIHDNFFAFDTHVEEPIDGMFLDLGVSSMQLDRAEKGFSFSKEGPLDMRMDPESHPDAAWVVNRMSEKELGRIFREYGEERRWRRAAAAICEVRRKRPIKTTTDLVEVLKPVLTWGGSRKKIHPMTQVFQALRIFVNNELGGLEETLPKIVERLAPEGRLGVLTFHSLEDRIVKHTLRRLQVEEKVGSVLTKKPVIPREEELRANPRSRSAKLRFFEKKDYSI